ncbi:MAG: class I SAM-dependent methyltransferase [Lachnospiraceae bacterium]|nr:class I SAM-dependent methyltransferase [Lachnospiraceae bacterium]
MILSKRLQTIADMVTKGHCICDIGCDHAHIAIYLVGQGIAPRAVAMDIHTGPLERARGHIVAHGLADKIETRLSDGFVSLRAGEAETVIIAGMGGRLMQAILTDGAAKIAGIKELILGPQSEIPAFRRFLRMNGFHTEHEDLILEGDIFYPIIKAAPSRLKSEELNTIDINETEATTIADCYGHIPLKQRNPALLKYLRREQKVTLEIINQINNSSYLSKKNEEKLDEMRKKAAELTDLIGLWKTENGGL